MDRREFLSKCAAFGGGGFIFSNEKLRLQIRHRPSTNPVGTPQGIPGKEGRVVWEHDPKAVTWDGTGTNHNKKVNLFDFAHLTNLWTP